MNFWVRDFSAGKVYTSCYDAKKDGQTSGYTMLKPVGQNTVYQLWCDQTSNGGGWTRVMRGIAKNDIDAYSKTSNALNWPSDNRASTADSGGKTWKLSDGQINQFLGNIGATGAATIWVQDVSGPSQRFYRDCDYDHLASSEGGCATAYNDVAMTAHSGCSGGPVAHHNGVGCPNGACTHSNVKDGRGWYFNSGCANAVGSTRNMNFWVRNPANA